MILGRTESMINISSVFFDTWSTSIMKVDFLSANLQH